MVGRSLGGDFSLIHRLSLSAGVKRCEGGRDAHLYFGWGELIFVVLWGNLIPVVFWGKLTQRRIPETHLETHPLTITLQRS